VTLVLIRMPGYDGSIESADSSIDERIRVHRLDAPAPPWGEATMKGRLLRGLVQYPFDPLPFDCYPHNWPLLREVLASEEPDVVAFYLPVLAHLAEHAPSGVPVIGVLEEGWERLVGASLDGSGWKNAWLSRREATRFATVYRRLDKRASAVVAISEEERDWFRRTIEPEKIVVIPNGIDLSYFSPRDGDEQDVDVLVVGDLRSPRNYVGALETWEAARDLGWRWTFVGAADEAVAARLREGGAGVVGPVPDLRPYYGRARTVLVPAFAGTGVKSTSIQAWAMRRPLVTSPVGARGLPARPGENILVGDDAAALVRHLTRVLADPEEAERLAAGGEATAREHGDLSVIARRFAELCAETAQDVAPLVSPA
jgi:glycosyltransferase involved in cell wall biosynthesis